MAQKGDRIFQQKSFKCFVEDIPFLISFMSPHFCSPVWPGTHRWVALSKWLSFLKPSVTMLELIVWELRIGAWVSGLLVISWYSYWSKLHKRQEAFRKVMEELEIFESMTTALGLSGAKTRIFNLIYRAKNVLWYLWDHDVLARRFMNIIRANRNCEGVSFK